MNKKDFQQSFFKELCEDSEKGLAEWRLEGYWLWPHGRFCSVDWRGYEIYIYLGDIHKGERKSSCNISKNGEALTLYSGENSSIREKMDYLIEKVPFWVESRISDSILKRFGAISLRSEHQQRIFKKLRRTILRKLELRTESHGLHSKVLKTLEQLTLQGLQWEVEEGKEIFVEDIKCSGECKGVSIKINWYRKQYGTEPEENKSAFCLSSSDSEWRIDAGNIHHSYPSSDYTFYCQCQRCQKPLEQLIGIIYKTYQPKRVKELSDCMQSLILKVKEKEAERTEKMERIGMDIFGR